MTYQWQSFKITNSRGQKLAALAYRVPGNAGPAVIVCHGFTGSKEGGGRALEMAETLSQRGWSTLLFDFAGNGESEGNFSDFTLTGQIDDLNCAVDWCRKQGFSPIITLGRSFGGTTVLCQAAGNTEVAAVCTWAAPARLTALFSSFTNQPVDGPIDEEIPLTGTEGTIYIKKNFFRDLEKHIVTGCTRAISPRPLLIIHGTNDLTVSPGDAALIFNTAGEPKQLAMIEKGDHQFSEHYKQVWELVFQWLERHFRKA